MVRVVEPNLLRIGLEQRMSTSPNTMWWSSRTLLLLVTFLHLFGGFILFGQRTRLTPIYLENMSDAVAKASSDENKYHSKL